jgi:4-hydroxybutyryl-CoA dehydratase/vinylacetyl-CoA-Delta-isomerase
MSLMTAEEYRDSLKKLRRTIYFMGSRIEDVVNHPATRPHVNAAAMTYEMALDPQFEALCTATSHLSGNRISRFTHIHQSTEDLVKKVKMLRLIAQRTGSCFQRCVGFDALNALFGITYETDQKLGTKYHERFLRYLSYVQEKDLMCTGAMTDPKGARHLAPSQQKDPDLYLRLVEKQKEGIVVRGAKAHQTGAVNSHEVIVMPTAAMGEADQAYALAFAVPADASGLLYIFGRQTNDSRKWEGEIDQGNACFGTVGGEALLVFQDVFVPWERVFLCGEYDFAGPLVDRFASYHRQNYGGCKAGNCDIIIGAASAIALAHGVAGASHIREKVGEMVHLSETLYSGAIACSSEGYKTASGAYFVNPLLANTTKLNVTRFYYEVCRLAQDIAGGLLATMPSEQDLRDPEIGPLIEKYLSPGTGASAEERIRLGRLIENMTCGAPLVEVMHGAGSPQAMKIILLRQAGLEQKMKLARRLCGIDKS